MTAAIGSSTPATSPGLVAGSGNGSGAGSNPGSGSGSGGSAIALQAQLDRCTTQLGDWVSCPSGKTPEGQKIIQALEQQIGSLKAQIANSSNAGSSPTGSTPAQPQTNLPLASFGTLGTLLNALA